jgi:hypothetical protein
MRTPLWITARRTAEHRCPVCHEVSDGVTQVSNEPIPRGPEPGDISICAYCLTVSVFREDGTLRVASSEECADLPDWAKARIGLDPTRKQ